MAAALQRLPEQPFKAKVEAKMEHFKEGFKNGLKRVKAARTSSNTNSSSSTGRRESGRAKLKSWVERRAKSITALLKPTGALDERMREIERREEELARRERIVSRKEKELADLKAKMQEYLMYDEELDEEDLFNDEPEKKQIDRRTISKRGSKTKSERKSKGTDKPEQRRKRSSLDDKVENDEVDISTLAKLSAFKDRERANKSKASDPKDLVGRRCRAMDKSDKCFYPAFIVYYDDIEEAFTVQFMDSGKLQSSTSPLDVQEE